MGISFGKDDHKENNSTPHKGDSFGHNDPRSPSIGITRTPIQLLSSTSVEDPRSPSDEINRTPIVFENVYRKAEEVNLNKQDDSVIVHPGSAKNLEDVKLDGMPLSFDLGTTTGRQNYLPTYPLTMDVIKDNVKQKLQFDTVVTPSKLNSSPSRSPLCTRNHDQDQPLDIVRKKQLMKVAERMSLDPVSDKENLPLK